MLAIPELSERDEARFWSKVDKNGPVARLGLSPCWMWTASRSRVRGKWAYGDFGIRGKIFSAHRVAYVIAGNTDPGCLFICHECDNPGCVNPEHLFIGTNRENCQDRKRKGRGHNLKGTCNGRAKLTEEKVAEILYLFHKEGVRQNELAARYGATKYQISRIINKKAWVHVQAAEGI